MRFSGCGIRPKTFKSLEQIPAMLLTDAIGLASPSLPPRASPNADFARPRLLRAQMAASHRGCVKTQMRDRRMVGQLAIFDCRISTDVLRSMSF
jgi:hypothetical protein